MLKAYVLINREVATVVGPYGPDGSDSGLLLLKRDSSFDESSGLYNIAFTGENEELETVDGIHTLEARTPGDPAKPNSSTKECIICNQRAIIRYPAYPDYSRDLPPTVQFDTHPDAAGVITTHPNPV